jgi:aquaporin Z
MDVVPPPETAKVVAAQGTGRKFAVELIGTFFLVFTVGASVYSGSSFAPLTIGAVLLVMIYLGGRVSGGHYNPAVTLAALARGRIGLGAAVGYWIAQLVAGLFAAVVVRRIITPASITTLTLSSHTLTAAFVVELLFTFALTYVVLNVATSKNHTDNSFYGLAIGFTVVAGAVAVALGGAAMGLFAWSTFWVYPVAEIVAGTAAGLAFRTLTPDN